MERGAIVRLTTIFYSSV